MTSSERAFRVSVRVQLAGVTSLLVIPVVLAAVVAVLFAVSVALGLVVLLAFSVAGQAALARHWTLTRLKPVSVAQEPALHALVERLCVQSGLPKPKIVLHPVGYANSWVKGFSAKRSTLHLTKGLIELLDPSLLEGVVAHELAHIGQRDSPLMSGVGAPVESMLAGAAFYFHTLRAQAKAYATDFKPDGQPGQDAGLPAGIAGILPWLLFPIGLGFLVLGEACRVVAAWFSRVRELEADAGAARLTGNPAALASALVALSQEHRQIPLDDLRRASSLDVFHIVAMRREPWVVHSHPSLKRRLAQLDRMETRLQHSAMTQRTLKRRALSG